MHEFRHREAPGLDKLWVVAVISNPARYKTRYDLYSKFKKSVETAGANLLTVELALGDRPFEVTQAGNPLNIQLRTWDELWHKENLINIGISRLPSDWQYVAWVDADVEFLRQDWPEETVQQLQQYQVIQMFQNAIDLGPDGEVLQVHNGFVWSWMNNIPKVRIENGYYSYGHYHPGYAWAARREAIDSLGGLLDTGILGASDHHMAHALIGKVIEESPKNISAGYKRSLLAWQDRALTHIKKDIGYMKGTIQHHFHGPKRKRFYGERWDIIHRHKFDPEVHLKKDWQGLYQLTHAGEAMRNDLRGYFRARDEDDIRVD